MSSLTTDPLKRPNTHFRPAASSSEIQPIQLEERDTIEHGQSGGGHARPASAATFSPRPADAHPAATLQEKNMPRETPTLNARRRIVAVPLAGGLGTVVVGTIGFVLASEVVAVVAAAAVLGAALGSCGGYFLGLSLDKAKLVDKKVKVFVSDLRSKDLSVTYYRNLINRQNAHLSVSGLSDVNRLTYYKCKKVAFDALSSYLKQTRLPEHDIRLNDDDFVRLLQFLGDPADCNVYVTALMDLYGKVTKDESIAGKLAELMVRPVPPVSVYEMRMSQVEAMLEGRPPRRAELLDLAERIARASMSSSIELIASTAISTLVNRAFNAADTAASEGTGFAAANGSARLVESISQVISDTKASEVRRLRNIHALLRVTSESDIKMLPTPVRTRIAELDLEIDQHLTTGDGCSMAKLLMKRRQGCLVSYPADTRLVAHLGLSTRQPAALTRMDASVASLLAEYPHIPELDDIITQIRDVSRADGSARRVQLFLVGEPGVGKTRFVRRLSEVLQLPMRIVKLTGSDDLKGFGMPGSLVFRNPDSTNKDVLSTIPYEITRSGCKNPILFFDEMGEVFGDQDRYQAAFGGTNAYAEARNLVDPSYREMNLEGLGPGITMDTSMVTIIWAGNSLPKDAALCRRFLTITFPPIPQDDRPRIANAALADALAGQSAIYKNRWVKIQRVAETHLNIVLEVDRENDLPGVREMNLAIEDLVSLARSSVLDARPISPKKVRAKVEARYYVPPAANTQTDLQQIDAAVAGLGNGLRLGLSV